MLDKVLDQIPEKYINFFIKIILVAATAMSIKIAIQMKKEKVSLINIILSFIIGVGFAAISGNIVLEKFSPSMVPIIIGAITLIGEKVGTWVVYKLNIDAVMQDLLNYLLKRYKKK